MYSRVGDWKLVKGTTYNGAWDSWYGPSGRTGYTYSWDDIRYRIYLLHWTISGDDQDTPTPGTI